jgi:hypothetical protein
MLQGNTRQQCSTVNMDLALVSEQGRGGLLCSLPRQLSSSAVGTARSDRVDSGRLCLDDEYMTNYEWTKDWTEVSNLTETGRWLPHLWTFYKCRTIILLLNYVYSVNSDIALSDKRM